MNEVLVRYIWMSLALSLVSFLTSLCVYPLVLRMARVWKIYDSPNARKLHRAPVPVLGGPVVFAGIAVGIFIVLTFIFSLKLVAMLVSLLIMMCVGIIDDKRD